jgi:DNA-binding LytR/AlgR family response regulator
MRPTVNDQSRKIPWVETEMGIGPKEVEFSGDQRKSIYVRHAGRYIRVLMEELLWVEAMENYVQLQTTKEKLVVHVTMKSIAEALASKGFRRIHRSFIVKLDAIESIEENHVIIEGVALPIGKSYRAALLDGLTLI